MKENKVKTIIENAGIGLVGTKDYKIARFSTILGLALAAPLVPIGVIADAVKSVVAVSSLYIDGGKFVKECNDKIRNGKERGYAGPFEKEA